MQRSASFEASLRLGQIAEGHIARWLRHRCGYHVMPVYQLEIDTGKGPQVFAPRGELIAPDLLAWKGQQVRWVEAKRKTVFTWYRKGQRWTTGIDLRHYEDYRAVRQRSPWPVYLMFLHLSNVPSLEDQRHGCPSDCPTGLFAEEIMTLARCESHRSDRHGRSGMVYWAHDDLKLLASRDEVLTAAMCPLPPTLDAVTQGQLFVEGLAS